jgi:mannose-1-phosphate guanylyltransferase
MLEKTFALILAGGSGERFWPLSRQARPKQLLNLFGDKALIEETLDRLEGLVPRENILILTNEVQEKAVRDLLPDLPAENIVAEPAKRDTAPAIALAAGWVAARDPEAVMMVLPADHLIKDVEAFQGDLTTAVEAARQPGAIVTIGIKPTWACPGYGYIEYDPDTAATQAMPVKSFREKPSAETAEDYLRRGNFRWNAGMFFYRTATIIEELSRQTEDLGGFAEKVAEKGRDPQQLRELLGDDFPNLTKISIDFAVMEGARKVLMVESHFDWDDIGGWMSVARYLKEDDAGNRLKSALTALDSQDNVVYNTTGSRVALLGVHDMIIIQTDDALLVCNRHEAEKIKKLVAELPDELC